MWFASYHTARATLLTADRLRSETPTTVVQLVLHQGGPGMPPKKRT